MSTTNKNTNNNAIMTSNSDKGGFHDFTAKKKMDFDLNEPLISTSLEPFSPRTDLNLVPNSQELYDKNNCFTPTGGSQINAIQINEDVKLSNNADALLKFSFDLNVVAGEEEDDAVPISGSEEMCGKNEIKEPTTSHETKLPVSMQADNTTEQLEATEESDVPPINIAHSDDHGRCNFVAERVNVIEGGSASSETRKREREEEDSQKNEKVLGRILRGKTVILECESEREAVMEDRYSWRKYGQKIIKERLYPRSYYRCTRAGCLAKKQVERDSHNDKIMFITYKGNHNHELPTPAKKTNKKKDKDNKRGSGSGSGKESDKNNDSSNGNTSGEDVGPKEVVAADANAIPTSGSPGNLNIPNAAALGIAPNQELPSGVLGPNNNGFGGSNSTHLMHFPTLNNANTMPMPFQYYGLNPVPYATPPPGPPMFPVFPTAPPFNFASPSGGFPHAWFNVDGSIVVFPFWVGARGWYPPGPNHRNN